MPQEQGALTVRGTAACRAPSALQDAPPGTSPDSPQKQDTSDPHDKVVTSQKLQIKTREAIISLRNLNKRLPYESWSGRQWICRCGPCPCMMVPTLVQWTIGVEIFS
jgi:hypothetical protein